MPIQYQLTQVERHRFRHLFLKKRAKGYRITDKGIRPYLKSEMTRYISDYPIIPIGYIRTRTALMPKNGVCKFTPEGRALIHRNQNSVPEWQLQWLREHPITSERATMELNDNRISLFVAQNGKCAVMGDELILTDMDCHHKTLWHEKKDDRYVNLMLLSRNVHRLIHATTRETIQSYLELLKPNEEQRNKLNQFRKMVGNEAI